MFRYDRTYDPPAPVVQVTIRSTAAIEREGSLAALLDTGADMTIVPVVVASQLATQPTDHRPVQAYDSSERHLPVYSVLLSIANLADFPADIVGSPDIDYAILGRDVINQFRTLLDGPALTLEISAPS